jgi:hypothetical protein
VRTIHYKIELTADTSQEGSRRRRRVSQHLVGRTELENSGGSVALGDSTGAC